MDSENWTTEKLAAYLRVSPSWVRERIGKGQIRATQAESVQWPEWKSYRITKEEVKRVLREVPLPATGETLSERLQRGCKLLYREMGTDWHTVVTSALNLELDEDQQGLFEMIMNRASRRPRPRKGGEPT
ncbi:MAG: hypothetical protein WC749_12165 [Dehalococcoidia bacterium]